MRLLSSSERSLSSRSRSGAARSRLQRQTWTSFGATASDGVPCGTVHSAPGVDPNGFGRARNVERARHDYILEAVEILVELPEIAIVRLSRDDIGAKR